MQNGSIFSKSKDVRVTVIGGGTGSFTVLSGLKNYTQKIVALVNMADDGGSTGKLRDEFGVLPPGDARQCLVALSRIPEMRQLFNYRFDSGDGLSGHAFGNLFLTALEKMTGDFGRAVELAGEMLNIVGLVEPITLSNVQLGLRKESGEEIIGEFIISEADFGSSRPELFLKPQAEPNPFALQAIAEADLIVVAPGNLYASLAPALLTDGVGQALKNSPAKKVYISNLVTKPGQTDGFSVIDFADEVQRLAGADFLDYVLYNTENPSPDLIEKYAKEGEKPVKNNKSVLRSAERNYELVGVNLLASTIWQNPNSSDPIAANRTLIRHDSDAVAKAIMAIAKM